jgi:hypothetical protein
VSTYGVDALHLRSAAAGGARVFIRRYNGEWTIVAIASKSNEENVIKVLQEIYPK